MVELMTLTSELQRAAATLETDRPDGPCDDTCRYVTEPTADIAAAQLVSIGMQPERADVAVPIARTLGSQSMPGRPDEWQRLLAHGEHREPIDSGLRATFGPATPFGKLMRLAAAEQDCCQFFTFAITIDYRGVALEVRAPLDGLPVLHSLFGASA